MTQRKTLNPQSWRELMRKYGRQYVEMEDMKRLGFLDITETELEELKEGLAELTKLRKQESKLNKELAQLPDVESMLAKVRKMRIERVRQERIIRKEEKAKTLAIKKVEDKKQRLKTPFYLGAGVSSGLKFEGEDIHQLKKGKLPVLKNAEDIAKAMELTTAQISWLSYHRGTATIDHYHRFKIPKSKGGFRNIAAPKPILRHAQEWILAQILEKIPLHDSAMAFRTGRSIVDNAQAHENGGVIIRLDLKDFFPSIKFNRVKGIFKSFGYNEGVATIFALICTDSARIEATLDNKKYFVALTERYLPQGACTSPSLTNIICKRLDSRLTGLCQKFDFTYTRYADDMVMSHLNSESDVRPILKSTQKIIAEEGFILHPDKLKIMRPHQRQSVTGIVINNAPNVSRRDLRNFRSFLHHYEKEGAAIMTNRIGKDATHYAKGYLSFIHMVNPQTAKKIRQKHAWLNS